MRTSGSITTYYRSPQSWVPYCVPHRRFKDWLARLVRQSHTVGKHSADKASGRCIPVWLSQHEGGNQLTQTNRDARAFDYSREPQIARSTTSCRILYQPQRQMHPISPPAAGRSFCIIIHQAHLGLQKKISVPNYNTHKVKLSTKHSSTEQLWLKQDY